VIHRGFFRVCIQRCKTPTSFKFLQPTASQIKTWLGSAIYQPQGNFGLAKRVLGEAMCCFSPGIVGWMLVVYVNVDALLNVGTRGGTKFAGSAQIHARCYVIMTSLVL